MNLLIKNGTLTEQSCDSNFAYVLSDNRAFLPTEYKVLQSRNNNGFIKCMKMLCNGKIQLYYLTSNYRSFASLIPTLSPERFIAVVATIFADIIEVKTNGFLSCRNIDISFDRIYIDVNTSKAYLVYLPISVRAFDDVSSLENELRVSLVKVINDSFDMRAEALNKLSADLSDGSLSIEDVYNRLKGIVKYKNKDESHKAVSNTQTDNKKAALVLTSVNTPLHIEFKINKAEYLLGKKAGEVDGLITFNAAVSRVHCKIARAGNDFVLIDLGSANGTFLNTNRLVSNKSYKIKDGDIVTLANIELKVHLEQERL